MVGKTELIGKDVIVFYDDGGSVSRKEGKVTSNNKDEICLDDSIILPKSRIVRIEIKKKEEE